MRNQQENRVPVNPKDQMWNITQNNDNHLRCVTSEKIGVDGCHQDTKIPSPIDALLGKDNENGLRNKCTVLKDAENNKNLEKRTIAKRRCLEKCYRWPKKNQYIVLIIGLVMFFVGCTLLAISVYLMHTRGSCDSLVSDLGVIFTLVVSLSTFTNLW